VTVFKCALTIGASVKVGVKLKLPAWSLRSTNSSKVRVISFELKLSPESGGLIFRSLGGVESLGPPEGGTTLAQPVGTQVHSKARQTITKKLKRKGFLMRGKLISFYYQTGLEVGEGMLKGSP